MWVEHINISYYVKLHYISSCVHVFDYTMFVPGLDMSLHKEQAYPVTNISIENGHKSSKWSIGA